MRKLTLVAIVALMAVSASADLEGMRPVVAPDGTILVNTPTMTTDYRVSVKLRAISPAGKTLWTWNAPAMMHSITFGGSRIYVATNSGSNSMWPPMLGAGSWRQEIVALSLADGNVQWRREFSGIVGGIEVAGDRLYVVVGSSMMNGIMMPGRGTGPNAGELAALDAATGVVLWSVDLD